LVSAAKIGLPREKKDIKQGKKREKKHIGIPRFEGGSTIKSMGKRLTVRKKKTARVGDPQIIIKKQGKSPLKAAKPKAQGRERGLE